jgi:hypothetical protein
VRQLERRVAKLEKANPSTDDPGDEIDRMCEFLSQHEMKELAGTIETLIALKKQAVPQEQVALEWESYKALLKKFADRSATRRERYPILYRAIGKYGNQLIPEPWSEEREIEAFRDQVARNWEQRGLALVLDTLTPTELGIIDRLRGRYSRDLASFDRVSDLVTSPDEIAIEKVWFYARVERGTGRWVDMGRPLTWADLKLDPANFNRRAA